MLFETKARTAMTIFTGTMIAGYTTLSLISGGSCPAYDPLDDFDVEAFKGVWYELQRDKDITFESGECVTAQYEDDERGVSVENTEYWPDESRYEKINGFAVANTWYPG